MLLSAPQSTFLFSAVKLPEILYYANIEETTLVELQQNLVNFLKYELFDYFLFFLVLRHTNHTFHNSVFIKSRIIIISAVIML